MPTYWPWPLHAVEDGVDLLVGQGIGPAELGVEISGVLGHIGQRVVDLVKQRHRLEADVGEGDPAPLAEGHLPVAVERAARIHADRQRGDLARICPSRRRKNRRPGTRPTAAPGRPNKCG